MNSQIVLDLGDMILRNGMDFEGIVAQLQPRTHKVLCVEDGLYLRVYEGYGPFPFGVVFEHKHRRFGMTEYVFRCGMGTNDEKSFCVFGRDNAETFCPDFIDDQCTSSEEEIHLYDDETPPESPYSEIFSSSTSVGSEEVFHSSPFRTDSQIHTENVRTEEEEVKIGDDETDVHVINISHFHTKDQIQEETYKL